MLKLDEGFLNLAIRSDYFTFDNKFYAVKNGSTDRLGELLAHFFCE